MRKIWQLLIASVIGCGVLATTASVEANEPGWSWQVITFGQQRRQIESTPMLQRPYRPLHFYGNTARRHYYRGNAIPLIPNDQRARR